VSDGESLWNDPRFRERVIEAARLRGMSLSDVCRKAGLSTSYLSKPAGRAGRSMEAVLCIAQALDVSVIELLGTANHHDATPSDENLARLALVAEVSWYFGVALGARRQIPYGVNAVELVATIMSWIDAQSLDQRRQVTP